MVFCLWMIYEIKLITLAHTKDAFCKNLQMKFECTIEILFFFLGNKNAFNGLARVTK